jgi:L-ascorbate metabolism protein UlaG (beta-lactamase superfamily)
MRLLAVPLLLLAAAPAVGQDKAFKLRYFGLSFFQLETPGGKQVAFDPHLYADFGAPLVTADIICLSHVHKYRAAAEAVENAKAARVFSGLKPAGKNRPLDWNPTDEKIGTVRVRTVGTYHDADDGKKHGKNAVFVVEADGLVFCHLGNLGHELTPAQVKAIGPVDVLLVPVGGVWVLNGESAKAVVKAVKRRLFVLPMHYGTPTYDELQTPDEFLDGTPGVRRMPATNELTIPAKPKAAAPTVVLLGWKPAGK